VIAKVCGLTAAADVTLALAAGAELLGFLCHPASPRHCPEPALAGLAGERAVLVAVAADPGALLALAAAWDTPWVQPYLPLAGRAEAIAGLRGQGRKVLLPWPDEPDQEALEADLYLWETSPARTGLLGGSGQGHAMANPPPGPFLLAGGLLGANLEARLRAMPGAARARCRGFDAASRLEAEPVSSPRRKDPALVQAFVQAAHALPCHRSEP
jgi:phosphoribosylanthranilate isomerase